MRIFAADRLTLDLFAAAIAGDRTAREIVIGYVLPTRLPPLARKRLRDSRILTLAAYVSAQSPGITPYEIADALRKAGAEIEGGRALWHPAFADLDTARVEISAIIDDMLTWLEPHARTGERWPSLETLYRIIH
jgi:hypothetical protein